MHCFEDSRIEQSFLGMNIRSIGFIIIFIFSCILTPNQSANASNIDQEIATIKQLCRPLKGVDNSLCQIAALHLGSEKFSRLGQTTTSAPTKTVATLGNLCKKVVPEILKSPGSARFPDKSMTRELFTGMYVVTGKVDSQNSYGALLRSNYYCYMRNLPKKGIEVIDVDLL
jgi:hypothetical protein